MNAPPRQTFGENRMTHETGASPFAGGTNCLDVKGQGEQAGTQRTIDYTAFERLVVPSERPRVANRNDSRHTPTSARRGASRRAGGDRADGALTHIARGLWRWCRRWAIGWHLRLPSPPAIGPASRGPFYAVNRPWQLYHAAPTLPSCARAWPRACTCSLCLHLLLQALYCCAQLLRT